MAKAVKAAIIVAGIATGVGLAMGTIAGGGAFTALGLGAGTVSAFFARQFVTAVVLGALSGSMSKKPSGGIGGTTVSSRSSIAPRQVIYGRTRVGGTIVYMESTNSNKYLHTVIAMSGHEVDAIEKVYLNDEEVVFDGNGNVTSGNYANVIRIKTVLGTADQAAFTELVAESDGKWTTEHRMRGCAAVYVRMEYDQDKFPSGVPNVSALIRGKKVYDPRSGLTAWSQNPALCLNDYLTNTDYGLGCVYSTEINSSSLITAANICDEDIVLDAGGTENTYEINGAFATSANPEEIINSILSSMIGKAVWSGGKWRILAGAYYTPTLSFDEGDLRSGFKVQTKVSRRENFNSVKGTHISIDDNYIATDFPPIVGDGTTNATMANYVAQDNGELVYKTIVLPFTNSSTMAQRIAKIELERARQQITVSLPLKLVGLKANVGDVILLNNTRMGWSSKPFEVVSMSMTYSEEVGVDLELRETASEVFDWTSGTDEKQYDPAPDTNLPNPFSVASPTDLTLESINTVAPDGVIQSGILVTWTPPLNSFVTRYEVQYIRGASNFDWGSVTEASSESSSYGLITSDADTAVDYGSVADATAATESNYNSVFVTTPYYVISSAIAGAEYAVRVRSINSFGVRSPFVTSNEITYGDQTAPNPPSEVTASGGYKFITVSWINPTVADFDFVEIYRNSVNDSATATRVGVLRGSSFLDSPLAINVTRYYWLKAVDRSGNKSDFSLGVSATTEFVDSDSFTQEVLNLFAEAGAYGIEPVATLPETGDFDGQIKYDTTTNKLYRWDLAAGIWNDDIFSITSGSVDEASFASGLEPVKIVSELPNPVGYTGSKIVFNTTDNKVYRYNGTEWTTSLAAADLSGEIAASNFAQDLRPVEIVTALPSSGNFQGRVVVLTSDNKLYRYTGTSWTAAVSSTDISGAITSAQIASVAASAVTGTLTNSQIADLSTAKLTGTIIGTQVSDGAISTAKLAAGSVSTAKLTAGAVTADTIASNAITAVKIQSGAVESAKIAAGAIDAGKIAANAITSEKIAAGAVTAETIASNAITTGKLAAGAVTADIIASNAITTGKISAGAVTASQIATSAITSDKILAGAIQTDKIAANSITGGLIAAAGVITSAAQINDAVITNAKIANGAITTAKIGDAQITTAKLGAVSIGTAQIADAAITTAKLGAVSIGTAQIVDAAVSTLKIAGQAVTVPAGANQASTIYLAAPPSYSTLMSVSIDSQGQPIYVLAVLSLFGVGNNTPIYVRLLNNGSIIKSWTLPGVSGTNTRINQGAFSFFVGSPGTGVRTMTIQAASALAELGTAYASAGNTMFAIGTKR